MKFKFVENYDYYTEEARLLVQEYAYDAIDELKDASFDVYFKWFLKETEYNSDPAILKQAVKDFYIEAVDSGKIKQPKTMITKPLTDYISANKHLIDNLDELVNRCPEHLKSELKLVIDAANLTESLNEDLPATFKKLLYDFIKEHLDLLNNDVDELYLLCPVGLKRDLVELLNSANIKINKELINKFEFLVTEYNPQDLDRIVIDHDGKPGTTTDNVYYIITNWDKFDFPAYKELNEDLLTEKMWVKVEDNTGLSEPFYFYATDKNTLKDVNTLLPIIKNKQKGTYKQQLNQDIVKELQSNYNNSSKKYILKIVSANIPASELEAMKNRIITITDRDLRKQAEQDVIVSTKLNPKHYLIHHKHKGEENNKLSNIMLVSRSSGDASAHAVHKLLEFQGPAVRVGSTSVPVFEHDGTNWIQTFTVDITIR